ncbi:MAG: Ig-like domain-containing protein, partial [Pseudomonadota bacterium]
LVTVTVNAVNDPPNAADDTASTAQGEPIIIDVLANDTDVDGEALTLNVVSIIDTIANAAISVNPDGTLLYQPDVGFTGFDEFDYVVGDEDGLTDTGSVTVEVVSPTVLPTPVFEQPGAKSYSGSSADVDNYDPDDLNLAIPTGTIAFSFVDSDPNSRQGLVTKDASGFAGGGNHFAAYIDDGNLNVRIQNGLASDTLVFEDLNAGQEYEVAVVFGSDDSALYVDGAISDTSIIGMDWSTNVEWLQIGGLGWSSKSGKGAFKNPVSGQIADVEIYDEALDQLLIEALANQSSIV